MTITAAQVRAARGLFSMAQDDLALLARVTRKTLATFESEGREPWDATLAKL